MRPVLPLASLVLAACAGRAPPGPAPPVPCAADGDCASVGAGAFCLSALCRVLDVDGAPAVAQPAPQQADLTMPALIDTDPDPAVFQASLRAEERDVVVVASGGAPATTAWVYVDANAPEAGGARALVGPRIEVAAGTRVRIHFENALPVPTTIHWHGVSPLPPGMNGAGINGSSIQPGTSFDFNFVARDAGLYWYHPQVGAADAVERGLYGAFVVRDAGAVGGTPEPAVDVERVLMLDDILLDADAQLVPPDAGGAVDDDGRVRFASVLGRQGNHLLVNGREHPILDVTPGTVERWRIVNAANARFFRVASDGLQFLQIGSDGGLVAAPRTLAELVVAPGERVDVLIAIPSASGDVPLVTLHHDRGHAMSDPGLLTLATLRYAASAQQPATPLPPVARAIAPLAPLERPDKVVVIDAPTLGADGRVGFTFNGQTYPAVTPLVSTYGYIETWEIDNRSGTDQPFHLHGSSFQVLFIERDGVREAETFLAWKDTVVVPAGCKLRFVVRYTLEQGLWLFHGTTLEHAERGMVGIIDLRSMMG